MLSMNKNLTQYETRALRTDFNLADAHTHQNQSELEREIVANLPNLFYEAVASKQHEVDALAITSYHELSGQTTANSWASSHLCYSASMAMEVVANYLRLNEIKVGLIEPTFDNIPDILKRHQIDLTPIDDEQLACSAEVNWGELLSNYAGQAIFLTLPNNPTGTYLTEFNFETLAETCKRLDILLMIDMCFRLYEPAFLYDQYKILKRVDVPCVIIEDTGKVWPALDLKFSILNCHPALSEKIYDIHSDFLLNVSPFILRVLPEFFEASKKEGFKSTRQLVKKNRAYLRDTLAGTFLEVAFPDSNISVEFLRINAPIKSTEVQTHLAYDGVYVLPGDMFFWNTPALGQSYIRIALAREFNQFKASIDKLSDALKRLKF